MRLAMHYPKVSQWLMLIQKSSGVGETLAALSYQIIDRVKHFAA